MHATVLKYSTKFNKNVLTWRILFPLHNVHNREYCVKFLPAELTSRLNCNSELEAFMNRLLVMMALIVQKDFETKDCAITARLA